MDPQNSPADALFVYYKIDASQHASIAKKLSAMVVEIGRIFPNISVEIMQRPEKSPDNLETWMEIYRGKEVTKSPFIKAIADLALSYELPTLRRVEIFIPLPA